MFVRCTSSTRSCSERRLSSRVVATLLAIVPLLLLEPTRRPLLSGLQAQRFRVRLEDDMTVIKGSDGSWTWNGGKEGAQRFDELAQAEALAKFDELLRRRCVLWVCRALMRGAPASVPCQREPD